MYDRKTQDAVVRNLEIIGEAANKLSPELHAAHPDIPWYGAARDAGLPRPATR